MTPFARALLSPETPDPDGLRLPQGGDAARRFAVYRNNVAVALCEALSDNFPVVTSLVGREFMLAAARIFITDHPPQTPVLAEWGEDFPDWLASFGPAASLAYLPGIARLEQLCRASINARDAAPLDPRAIAAMPPEALADWRPRLHPSTRFFVTRWPLLRIRAHALGLPAGEAPETGEIVITRPAMALSLQAAPIGTIAALTRLGQGTPLGNALDGQEAQDPAAILTFLLHHHAFAAEETS
ncbi:MAG: putative DNA-binding domain-containing protein [Paracoccus sp. (in: a-proteobacteria)]